MELYEIDVHMKWIPQTTHGRLKYYIHTECNASSPRLFITVLIRNEDQIDQIRRLPFSAALRLASISAAFAAG